MHFDWDEIIERADTDSLKFDFAAQRGKPEGLLPLWVADMDFRSPPAVIDALTERSRHGIFGYTDTREDYTDILRAWFSRCHGWDIDPAWLIKTPGVVFALCAAIRAYTQPGDAVIIQQPVYYPFEGSIRENGRRPVVNELVYADGRYSIDFDDFETRIMENSVKLFILCSPHNPVGRVWTEAELVRMGDICVKHGVIVVSDEIHQDFVFPGYKHLVFSALKPEYAAVTVTCTAPSKTFNLAGLQISNVFVPDRRLRDRLKREISRTGYSQLNTMGIVACKAAYAHGQAWLDGLRAYLLENLDYVRSFLQESLPHIRLVEPEGTYLLWLDCKALGLDDAALEKRILHDARLWLDTGTIFGAGGSGFQRINMACPRSTLQTAMERLERALRV